MKMSKVHTGSSGTISNGGAADLLTSMPRVHRQRIARLIRKHRNALADGWVQRHQRPPLLREAVLDQLDGGWDEYRQRFALPLLYVLERGFRSGQKHFFYIYSAQRLRFFPLDMRKRGGQIELAQMLEDDLQALVAVGGMGDLPAGQMAAVLRAVHRPLMAETLPTTLKMAFVGDCALSEIQSFLLPLLEEQDVKLESRHLYFSARVGTELNTSEIEAAIGTAGLDLIALSFLTFEGLPLYTSLIHEASSGASDETLIAKCDAILALIDRYVTSIRDKTNTPILLHGCSGLPLSRIRNYLPILPAMSRGHALVARRLDEGLAAMASGTENVIFVDERAITMAVGRRAANRRLLPRIVTRKALFHPSAFGKLLAEEYAEIARAYTLLAKAKVLLIDFDNTLWNGVMADGEVLHDTAGQALLKELKQAGMLLVSVSKNDPKNIRWGELVLDEDDFVLHKISWDMKPQSVADIAHQLDLDPRSFVLIDDNPVERDLVTSAVPGVIALDPTDARTWRYLRMLLEFPATRQTDEAGRRTAMYREAAMRREAQSAHVDYGAMMHSLDLKAGWRRAKEADLDRLHELVSRTNQFNTTTLRYTAPDLAKLMASAGHDVFVATLSDKFGSLGIVGTAICSVEDHQLVFDSVVMSCRAMGFGLEALLVRAPLDEHPDVDVAVGRYVSTERNSPCADLFPSSGFTPDGAGAFTLALRDGLPEIPAWLTVEKE